ncbi:hypothetical protein [Candidiatus Paracoxiella cheracis]|uniref:hypothetical protein n=1 Tax=Candidiatus Paracoxiella cheracis TaxID=3405120 RepID=UPI003BF4606D
MTARKDFLQSLTLGKKSEPTAEYAPSLRSPWRASNDEYPPLRMDSPSHSIRMDVFISLNCVIQKLARDYRYDRIAFQEAAENIYDRISACNDYRWVINFTRHLCTHWRYFIINNLSSV